MPGYDAKWLFYEQAGGRCQWCSKKLVWANRGREGRGAWEMHHHPPKSHVNRTFEGSISPDMIMLLRILCWDCHRKTLRPDFPDAAEFLR